MKRILILSLALIALLGIMSHGTSGLFSDTETSTGNTFSVATWVEGVVCAKFNVSDKQDSKIYKYDDTGASAGSFSLSDDNGFPTGVAAAGDYVYVIDHADKQVYKYTCSGTYVDVSKDLLKADGNSSIGNIEGLAIDGDEMWVLSGNDMNIYLYSLLAVFPDSGSLNAAQEIPLDTANKGAAGLAIDNGYLYVVDYKTSSPKETRFYCYPRSGGPATVSRVLAETTASGGANLESPAGAMFDGTSLWVVDSSTNKIYEYDKDDPFPGIGTTIINAESEFDLDGNNDDATGL